MFAEVLGARGTAQTRTGAVDEVRLGPFVTLDHVDGVLVFERPTEAEAPHP